MLEFPYSPLLSPRDIRLIHLLPGSRIDPVECKLVHVDLDTEPEYECISYVWGDPMERQDIVCNSLIVSITASLHSAFVRVRLEHDARVIWADALAIDQTNNNERSVQVLLMHTIYSKCQRCLCWTGPGTSNSAQAFSLIREVVRQTCEMEGANTSADIFYDTEKRFFGPGPELENLPKSDQPEWRAIGEFFSRPYFSRVWIIQEVAAPPEALIMCGWDELPYEDIGVCARWIVLNELRGSGIDKYSDGFTNLGFFHASLCRRAVYGHPLDSLDFGRAFGCSDPRDHLYGLLAHRCIRETFKDFGVDYSISFVALYTNMAAHIAVSDGRFDVLEYIENEDANLTDTNAHKLPSWVPNWTKAIRMFWPMFKAGGATCDPRHRLVDVRYNPQTATLRVPGIRFDEICWVGDPNIMDASEVATMPRTELGLQAITESNARLPYGRDFFSAYVSSLTEGLDAQGDALQSSVGGSIRQHKCDFAAHLLSKFPELLDKHGANAELVYQGLSFRANKDTLPALVELAKEGDANRFDRALRLRWAFELPMIYTKKGYLGIVDAALGTIKVLRDDVVAVIFTTRCCFILRQMGEYYRVIGKCYVHGIMWGEAMDMLEEGQLEETIFELV